MKRGFESLMVGRLLAGRYEVREPLARGGMSVVFTGFDRTLGREVAVKVVSLAAAAPEDALPLARERFRREAASAARIQHANVVQIFDYGTDPELELDFIVMELLRGRDLKQALAAGPLPLEEGLRVMEDAARGVAAGHRAGIVHRDVKPANVFLLGEGEGEVEAVKVLDFGIAKPLDDDGSGSLTTAGNAPHSPAYASPEQLDAAAALAPSSDVYQLGLVAYETLAGARAHTPDDRERVRRGEHVPLPRTPAWAAVPPAVREVVERAVHPSPSERPPDAAAFADALAAAAREPVADDETVLAAPLRPSADDTALLGAQSGMPIAPPPGPSLAGREGAPPTRRGIPGAPVLWAIPLLLVLAIAVWAARRGGEATDAAALPDTAAMAALDEEFLRLQGEAGSADPIAAEPVPLEPTPASATDGMAEAQREITEAVHDLNRAWVEGDLGRHVEHYASRVDYYDSPRASRSDIRRDRTRDLERYDDRRIGIHSVEIELVDDDRARVLVDKEWYFGGDGAPRRGRGMQEYVFQRDDGDGRWYVVSEQLLSTSEG